MTECSTDEEWKSIPGYEGWYDVSNLGRVKRIKGGWGCRAGHILKPIQLSKKMKYWVVSLFKDGQKQRCLVHKLVASAFIGPCPKGMEINHRDTIGLNNHLENLEYGTHKYNAEHAAAHGLLANRKTRGWRVREAYLWS